MVRISLSPIQCRCPSAFFPVSFSLQCCCLDPFFFFCLSNIHSENLTLWPQPRLCLCHWLYSSSLSCFLILSLPLSPEVFYLVESDTSGRSGQNKTQVIISSIKQTSQALFTLSSSSLVCGVKQGRVLVTETVLYHRFLCVFCISSLPLNIFHSVTAKELSELDI